MPSSAAMTYKKTIQCDTTHLKTLRGFVEQTLSDKAIPEAQTRLIVLAVDEVCSNRIIHAHGCNPAQCIEVSIKIITNQITISIKDSGSRFDIREYQSKTIEELIKNKKSGGIGLILVKKIMDKISVQQAKGKNICRLYKYLPAENL